MITSYKSNKGRVVTLPTTLQIMITLKIYWRRHEETHNIDLDVEQYNYDVVAIFDALWANETARDLIKTAAKHKTAEVEVMTDYERTFNSFKCHIHAIYDNGFTGGSKMPIAGLVEQIDRCERADMEKAVKEVQSKMDEKRHAQMYHFNMLTTEERKEVASYFGKSVKDMETICDQYRLRVYAQQRRREIDQYNAAAETLTQLAKGEYGRGTYGKVIARSKRDGSLWLVSPTYGFDDYNRSRLQTMMPLSQETINAFNRCVTAHL